MQEASVRNGKAVRFRSAAERKVSKLLKQIDNLGHLARTSYYDYSPELVAQMFDVLHAKLDTTQQKFAPQPKEKAPPASFTFG